MDLKGEYRIAAPREHVWALINDPGVLKSCIPGCESLEGTPKTGFAARVTTKIGPVKATFAGEVTLSNVMEPESLRISGEGKGGVAGFAKGGADVRLAEDGADTVLTYLATAQVGGKLAQLGSRLIDSTAKKLADEFFEKLAARAVMVDNEGLAEAIATAAVAAPVMSTAPSVPISPAAREASGPSVASAATAARPESRMPYIVAGLVAVAVIVIAALAA
jgi:uncharacterized protein